MMRIRKDSNGKFETLAVHKEVNIAQHTLE